MTYKKLIEIEAETYTEHVTYYYDEDGNMCKWPEAVRAEFGNCHITLDTTDEQITEMAEREEREATNAGFDVCLFTFLCDERDKLIANNQGA